MTPPAAFTVGVTGHRPNRLAIGEARARWRLKLVLMAIGSGTRAQRMQCTALSALAEGADRIFADVALELGMRLEVLLPFASADYEATFADAATTTVYHKLLARASHVEALAGTRADSKAAYEAVGRATVDRSDILVTVWDGAPAAGRGGTPDIIAVALEQNMPVIWIDAARDRAPLLLPRSGARGRRDVPLERLAARARPMTRRRIARLAARVAVGR